MELTPRKQAVLKAIIKAYIETGEPIGSKNLIALLENPPSSATLRNEMSDLCELGLLSQPHISAGRVPTNNGYRLYVNSLMNKSEISESQKAIIDRDLGALNCELEGIPAAAAQILSALTGFPAISCLITGIYPKIKRIELLPISRASVMLLLITDDGRTRNRVFRHNGLCEDCLQVFEKLVNKRVKNKKISELTKGYIQGVVAESGIYILELMPLFTAVFEAASDIEKADVTLRGENALYNICRDENSVRKITTLINRQDTIIPILENISDSVGVVFGDDTGYSELERQTFIAAKFGGNGKYKGYIGIIGPNRMSYEQIMPCIEYISTNLTEIMIKAQKDMED